MRGRRSLALALPLIAVAGALVGSGVGCSSFGATDGAPVTSADGGAETSVDAAPPGSEGGTADAGAGCLAVKGALLCDDFDGRTDLGGGMWEVRASAGTSGIVDTTSFSPSHSFEIAVPAGSKSLSNGLHAFPLVTGDGVVLRAALKLSAAPTYVQLISFITDGTFTSVVVDKGELIAQHQNGAGTAFNRTAVPVPVGTWFRVAYDVRFGPNGHVSLRVDDREIYMASGVATTPAVTVKSFELIVNPDFGTVVTTQPIVIHFDDIVLQ